MPCCLKKIKLKTIFALILFLAGLCLTLVEQQIETREAHAWVGTGVATLKGTQSTYGTDPDDINESTAYALVWSSSEIDEDFFTHDPSGANPERLVVDQTGDYLVSVTIPQVNEGEQRTQVEAEVYVNGTAVAGTIGGSSYLRQNSGHEEASSHVAALLPNLSVSDYIEVFVRQTGIAGVVNVDGVASLYVEQVKESRTIFHGTTTQTNAPSTPTNFNQTTAYELEWTEIVEDSGFTHSDAASPEDIQLDGSGYYLVFVDLPVYNSSANDRINPKVIVQLGGTTVNGGFATQGYLRDQSSYNNDSSVHWTGVVVASSDSQVLTVQTIREAAAGTSPVPSGKVGSIFVEKLSSGGATGMLALRGNDLTTGTDWDVGPPPGYVEWDLMDFKDSNYYTHNTGSNPHNVEVEVAGDYLLVYNDAMTSGTARAANKITVEVNGTTVTGAETKTHYMRQTGDHTEASGSLVFLLEDLMPDDVITIGSEREAANATTNDNEDAMLFLWYKGRDGAHTSQLHYRWRDDTTDLNTTGGWVAAEDTIYESAARNSTYRLRAASVNVGGSSESAGRTYELQFGVKSTTCAAISTWLGVDDSADAVDMVATAHITPDGESATSGLLTNDEGYTFVNGRGQDSADTTASIGGLSSLNYTEVEYSVQPTNSAPYGTIYCFRLYDTTAGLALDDYSNYAEFKVDQPFIEQLHYRWRDDSTDLNTGGGWIADEDSDPVTEISIGDTYRLRVETANTGSLAEESGHAFEIEYGRMVTSCAAISTWTGIGDSGGDFDMALTTHIDPDGETTTSGLLSNSEGYTYETGVGLELSGSSDTLSAISGNDYRELEFSIEATSNSTPGVTYCFRVVDNDGVLENYTEYPTLTVEGGFKVQKIIGSISGTLSQTETIDTISSLENAFIMMDTTGGSSTDNVPSEGTCTAYLSSTSQVTVEKSATSGVCEYGIYVVEALRNEFKVRGRGAISIDAAEASDTGSANNLDDILDTNKIFIPATMRSNGNGSDEWRETLSTVELTNSTTVTAEKGDNTGADTTAVVRYEVVEFLASGVSVQTGEADLTSLTTADQTVTLDTSVDTSRSFVYATFRHLDDGLAQTSLRMWLSDVDTISFDRNTGTVDLDSVARWWVVEFPGGGASVQRDEGSQSVTEDLIEVSIPTPIEISRSFPIFTGSNSGTGNAFPRGKYYSDLLDDSNAQFICGYDGNSVTYTWQIVDTSGFVADKYNFEQNDFEFFETANSVTLTNNWPPGNGDDLIENEAMTQIPASNETLAYGDQTRLQMNMGINGTTFPSSAIGFTLQYRESNDCTTYGDWTDVGAKGSGTIWRLFDEAAIGDSTTQVNNISTSDSSAEGYYSEINPSANNPNDVLVGENSEWDWPVENNGAADNTTYCFRMVLDDDRVLGSYRSDSFPKITTAPGAGDLMRHGKFFTNDTFSSYFWAD